MKRSRSPRPTHWLLPALLGAGLGMAQAADQAAGQAADQAACSEQVRLHGLLLAARPVCPLTHYSKMFQYKAESCESVLGTREFKRLLSEGQQALEARIKAVGKDTLCAKIRRDFPWTVR